MRTYESLPQRVVFGVGAARTALADEVAALGSRALLVCTEQEEPLARELAARVQLAGTFTGVRPHVPVEVAAAARTAAADAGADVLVAVGGGSTTGTAKAVALETGLPVLAVPTTYAGSEVTPVWGRTEAARKTTGTDPRVLPRTVVYDPELTLTLPARLSAVSGLNAVAHCVEAFWAPRRNPVASALAERGIRAMAVGLPGVLADGSDLAARSEALLGAWLAGAAFASAGSGLHHKVCHVLGGAYDLPHAETHAVVLPHVLALNAPAHDEAAEAVGRALGRPGGAAGAVAGLVELAEALGAPAGLREVGLPEDRLGEAADLVAGAVPPDNPVPLDRDGVERLLRAAWHGRPQTSGGAA